MNRLLWWLISFLCFFLTGSLYAQDVPTCHYTVEDGLPSNNIYSIYRDYKGFIWFGTDKGIGRYNGLKFEKFTMSDGLADNEVFFFREDLYGRMWMASYNGELCYFKDDTFHNKKNTPFLQLPVKVSFIRFIALESDSSITINFYDWSYFVNIKGNRVKMIYLPKQGVGDLFYAIIHIRKTGGIYEFYGANKFIRVDSNGNVLDWSVNKWNEYILRTVHDKVSYLVGRKHIFPTDSSEIRSFSPEFSKGYVQNGSVQDVYFGKYNIYISTNSGLVISSNKKAYIDDSFKLLKGSNITGVTQDIENNFWISTLNNGIFKLNNSFYNSNVVNNAYHNKVVYATVQNNQVFFTTADNDLYTLKNRQNLSCLLRNNLDPNRPPPAFSPGALLTSNGKYYSFYENELWVVNDVFAAKPKAMRYLNEKMGIGVKELFFIHNQLMFFYKRGVRALKMDDIKPGKDIDPYVRLLKTDLESPSRIFDVEPGPGDDIWYSTLTNMYRLVDSTAIVQPQFGKLSFKRFNFFGKYMVGYTHENQLWVCSDVEKNITMDAVPDQNCIWDKFYELDSNHILISTNGLYRLLAVGNAADNSKFMVTTIENPFVPLQPEAICADSSHCYFFKDGTITAIDKKSLMTRANPPQIFFTSLRSGNKYYPITEREIVIPYAKAKNMAISFGTLAFSGKNVLYEYSVSRDDDGERIWQKGSGEQINMIDPGFGRYTVSIRARTISSAYSKIQTFILVIERPYWANWWFIALMIIGMAGIITLFIRRRIYNTLRKRQRDHETEVKFMKSEYKALNALMNPHFIFNTLNNVQGLVNRNDKLAANEYLRVFADLIRQNMHNVSKELIPLQKELDLVRNYLSLEKLRFKDRLNYSIETDEHIDLTEIMVPPLLIQPLVENSIKHGILPLESDDGCTRIKIHEHNSILFIQVSDNGIGIEESRKKANALHESFGMENIKKRIEQLSIIQDKQMSLNTREVRDSENGRLWTVVTISIPL